MLNESHSHASVEPSGDGYSLARCAERHRLFVVKLNGHVGSSCPVCGSPGRIIPAAYYTEANRARLDQALELLYAAAPAPLVAHAAALRLDRLIADPTRWGVRAVLHSVPGFSALEIFLPKGETEQDHELRAFVGLLRSLLAAYAESTVSTPVTFVPGSIPLPRSLAR